MVLESAQGLDVTRALSRVTVTCISETSPKWSAEPLVVAEPPFFVESTTDAPFLARVTLDWNGQTNAQTVVEHWVQVSISPSGNAYRLTQFWCRQIDRLRTGYVAFGQEQLLDVELDRNTPLAPQQDNRMDWQTPPQPVPTRPTSTPVPVGPVIDETEMPDIAIPAGVHPPCDPSNDSPTESSGRVRSTTPSP